MNLIKPVNRLEVTFLSSLNEKNFRFQGPVVTDNGNFIIDFQFQKVSENIVACQFLEMCTNVALSYSSLSRSRIGKS